MRTVLLLASLLCLAPHGAASNSTTLARALDAIEPDRIGIDVEFLASDALGGRDTPSNGLQVAARYIRTRLKQVGFEPGAPNGYFYEYPLQYNRLDEERTLLSAKGASGSAVFEYGVDYYLSSTRSLYDADVKGEVVFCGTGSEEELRGVTLEDRWALCLDSDLKWHLRYQNVRGAGAIGLVVVPDSRREAEPFSERFRRVLAASRKGQVGWPSSTKKESESSVTRLTTVFVDDADAVRLLRTAGVDASAHALKAGTKLRLELEETRRLEGDGGLIDVENVCGFWRGSDPELSKEVILVSAHYDHLGTHDGVVFNGADDNGSGTAGLMALAEALAEYGPLRRSVQLIWVSGEEKGLFGSRAWAANPWLPEGCRAVADINIDMIGRNDPENLLVTPTRSLEDDFNGLTELAEKFAPLEGFHDLGSADNYWKRSDHYEFAKLGIPVTFFFANVHEDYHKDDDTADKVNTDKIRRVIRMVLRMLDAMQADELDL